MRPSGDLLSIELHSRSTAQVLKINSNKIQSLLESFREMGAGWFPSAVFLHSPTFWYPRVVPEPFGLSPISPFGSYLAQLPPTPTPRFASFSPVLDLHNRDLAP